VLGLAHGNAFQCTAGRVYSIVLICFVDYLDKLHRRGNKLILVHSIELPELSLHNASKSFVLLCVKICVMYY